MKDKKFIIGMVVGTILWVIFAIAMYFLVKQ